MSINRHPWPSDPVDMLQLALMVKMARVVEPDYEPPAPFQCTTHEESRGPLNDVDFHEPLTTLQRRTRTLFRSLPIEAQFLFYINRAMQGIGYAQTAVAYLRKTLRVHKNAIPLGNPVPDASKRAAARLNDVYNILTEISHEAVRVAVETAPARGPVRRTRHELLDLHIGLTANDEHLVQCYLKAAELGYDPEISFDPPEPGKHGFVYVRVSSYEDEQNNDPMIADYTIGWVSRKPQGMLQIMQRLLEVAEIAPLRRRRGAPAEIPRRNIDLQAGE
jgi:hypothetical protein